MLLWSLRAWALEFRRFYLKVLGHYQPFVPFKPLRIPRVKNRMVIRFAAAGGFPTPSRPREMNTGFRAINM
jgi:hypothetical protein